MRKLVVMILCATLAFTQSFAQNRTVSGKVTDEKGAAIAGASVVAKSSKAGTTTAADGTFKLTVANSVKVLTISSLNFVQKDVTIAANNTANASLTASAADALDEVVVVGYGAAKKKSDVTGSVVTVNAEKLQNKPTANPVSPESVRCQRFLHIMIMCVIMMRRRQPIPPSTCCAAGANTECKRHMK